MDAQYSSSGVLFGEIRAFAGVLTNACLSGFLVLFLVGFFFLFWRHCWIFCTPVAFWLMKQKYLPENLNYSDVDIGLSGDPGLMFRGLSCYSSVGIYVVTAVFNGFSLIMGLT